MISALAMIVVSQLIPSGYTFVPYNTGLGYSISAPYNSRGYYAIQPARIANPKIISINPPPEEIQGIVTEYDRDNRILTLRCRTETVTIHFHPQTRWRSDRGRRVAIRVGSTEVRYCAGVMTIIER